MRRAGKSCYGELLMARLARTGRRCVMYTSTPAETRARILEREGAWPIGLRLRHPSSIRTTVHT